MKSIGEGENELQKCLRIETYDSVFSNALEKWNVLKKYILKNKNTDFLKNIYPIIYVSVHTKKN